MIDFACRACGEELSVPESLAGQSETCPACGTTSVIPRRLRTAPVEAIPAGVPAAPRPSNRPRTAAPSRAPSPPPPKQQPQQMQMRPAAAVPAVPAPKRGIASSFQSGADRAKAKRMRGRGRKLRSALLIVVGVCLGAALAAFFAAGPDRARQPGGLQAAPEAAAVAPDLEEAVEGEVPMDGVALLPAGAGDVPLSIVRRTQVGALATGRVGVIGAAWLINNQAPEPLSISRVVYNEEHEAHLAWWEQFPHPVKYRPTGAKALPVTLATGEGEYFMESTAWFKGLFNYDKPVDVIDIYTNRGHFRYQGGAVRLQK